MARPFLRLLPLFLAACSDTGVKAFNAEPEAEITSHGDGDEVLEGYTQSFRGAVSDPDHAADELTATWYLDGEVLCESAAPDDDGITTCEFLVPEDASQITLEVQDPENAAGSDQVSLVVVPTEAPTAEISAPTAEGVYYSDQLITFSGTLADGEDAATDLVASWESNLDGVLKVDAEPSSEGAVIGYGYLLEGEHAIELDVTDTSGKTGTASVIVDVGPPNSAPSCEITAPEDGTAGQSGETITFEATVSDVDVSADWLAVSWESDKDGLLGESSPDSAGSVTFLTSDLSVESHVVTMSVIDEVGATCSDYIVYTVGTAPSISVASPVSGDVVGDGENVSFAATVSDDQDAATDLVLSWVSDLDGEFSTQGSDSTGAIAFTHSSLSMGTHTLTTTVTDTDGLYSSEVLTLQVNGLPTAPEVELSPDPATTSDDLVVSILVDSTDPEGDAITYSYAWSVDGVASSASSSSTLSSTDTESGQTWTVEVTPNDGYSDGPSGSDDLSIGNTAPEVSAVAIDPDPATAEDVLLCSWTFSDADSDSDASTLEWTVNGTSVGTDATLSGAFVFGDEVVCTVTAHDGTDLGNTDSASLTIDNTPPVLSEVTLSPDPAYEEDTLTCSPGETIDADGTEGFDYSYGWEVSGIDIGETGDTLDGDSFDKGDEVLCIVTPGDGDDEGDAVESNIVTIGNRIPEVTAVSLSPSTVYTDDTITASVSTDDGDGDSVSLSYEWYVDGSLVGETGSTLDGVMYFDKDQDVYVVVTPDDGTESGDALSSDSIIVSNSPPEGLGVSIVETEVVTETRCTALEFDGVDDYIDVPTSSSMEYDDDLTVEMWIRWDGETSAEWQWIMAHGDHWSDYGYRLQIFEDGYMGWWSHGATGGLSSTPIDTGTWFHLAGVREGTTWTIYIDGGASHMVTTSSVHNGSGQDLWVGGSGDAPEYSFDGAIDQLRISNIARYTSDFTPEDTLEDDGDVVMMWALDEATGSTATDSTANGNDGTISGAAWVEDCASPSSATQTALVCELDPEATDADGDALTYSVEWDVDGVVYTEAYTTTESGDTIPAEASDFGETWTCTVTVDDGDETATASDSLELSCPDILEFDGVDDMVEIPDLSGMETAMTMEAWVNLEAPPSGAVLLAATLCGSIYIESDQIWMDHFPACNGTDSRYTNSTDWVLSNGGTGDLGWEWSDWDGSWKHIAVTVDSSAIAYLYIDGSFYGAAALSWDGGVSGSPYTGALAYSQWDWLEGAMAGARFSSTMRYTSDFEPDYPLSSDSDTVLVYGFNGDGGSSSLTDGTGSGLDGTIVGATWSTGGPACETAE